MNVRNLLAAGILLGLLAACSLPHTDLKSPCVGAEGSPCARHPVNDWWLNPQGEPG